MRQKNLLLLLVSVLIIFVLISFGLNSRDELKESPKDNLQGELNTSLESNILNFTYTSLEPEEILEGEPSSEMKKLKSIYYYEDTSPAIHLYTNENIIYGFLESNSKLFSLGEIGIGELESIDIKFKDWNNDTENELLVTGDLGATTQQSLIIGFKESEPVLLLKTDNITFSDLDNNGRTEIVSSSRGSIPSYVRIYEWENDHYKYVDIEEVTGGIYATMYNTGTELLIESGRENESRLFRYTEGALTEVTK